MQTKTDTRPRNAAPHPGPANVDGLRDAIAGLLLEAARFISPTRVEQLARGWLARAEPGQGAAGRDTLLVADALVMATDLALFTPSASGATAFDRLARARGPGQPDAAAALEALRRAQFRLLRIEALDGEGAVQLRDLASGEVLRVLDESIPAEAVGVALVGRLAPLGDGRCVFAGGVTPLDEAGLGVAMGFVRPNGGRGLINPLRCAEAVYRHVLRHGTPDIPGLNRPPEGNDDPPEEGSELDLLALRWAEPGAAHDPADIQFVRTQADLGTVVAMLASVANTREHGLGALSGAYAAIALVQLETLHRRAVAGSGAVGLNAVAAAVDAAVAAGEVAPGTRDVFGEVRSRLGAAPSGAGAKDAELDRLIGRIQGLRAKTVEQGCTEQEALAAAAKVAELLDRYGLSLSELDLQQQACEGASVETERRRVGPVDDCVPAIAAFFDCRVWGEKSASGTLRYVFFGLPADVAASRYLYDLVEQAFETETARFRAGPTYAAAPTRVRRTSTNSFQIGLARGIVAKLQTQREAREATLRGASGRDLVVAKAGVVEAELAKLGLHLRARSRSGGRRVLRDAFEEGHEAGLGFEYTPGVTHAGS
jgi:hypothetical protein